MDPRRDPEDPVEGRGRRVDLSTVEPRREAIKFAKKYDRDPRQVEVVLREARRVVRMENGVLITETAHGFVCANGGIDASNVGPASGSLVTFLPFDPTAPRRESGPPLMRFGVDVPVVMSIRSASLALGHHRHRDRRVGMLPLEDLRARPMPTAGS